MFIFSVKFSVRIGRTSRARLATPLVSNVFNVYIFTLLYLYYKIRDNRTYVRQIYWCVALRNVLKQPCLPDKDWVSYKEFLDETLASIP